MFKSAKTKQILSYFFSGIMLVIFIVPFLVQAQGGGGVTPTPGGGGVTPTPGGGNPPINIKIDNPFKHDTIPALIETIVNDILMPIGGVVAVMMIMYAGFMYVTASGDPGKIKTAHEALKWAVIGAAILLGAWVISKAIIATVDQLRAVN
jgi:hypothetical protein